MRGAARRYLQEFEGRFSGRTTPRRDAMDAKRLRMVWAELRAHHMNPIQQPMARAFAGWRDTERGERLFARQRSFDVTDGADGLRKRRLRGAGPVCGGTRRRADAPCERGRER